MFEYFYHQILRKTVIGFGTLFNNIEVRQTNDAGEIKSIIKVPLAYGPTQKFLARIEQQPNLNTPVQITLPRMSFEFTGLSYDSTRKLTTTQTFLSKSTTDSTELKTTYFPVPYNMDFTLSIMTKLNDDMLQIIEQILPYFQPSYTLTINLIDSIGEKRDVPIILDNISMEDDYEGDFSTRRSLIYTLKFTAKTYLFGPVSSENARNVIQKVSLGFVSGDSQSNSRDLTYSTEKIATKNYTGTVTTTLAKDLDVGSTIVEVVDSSNIPLKSYFTINNETLYVVGKVDNKLTVVRGSYGTSISNHVSGSEVKLITSEDNSLIEFGDDFGFSSLNFS
jgi:hypothetical protein